MVDHCDVYQTILIVNLLPELARVVILGANVNRTVLCDNTNREVKLALDFANLDIVFLSLTLCQ